MKCATLIGCWKNLSVDEGDGEDSVEEKKPAFKTQNRQQEKLVHDIFHSVQLHF